MLRDFTVQELTHAHPSVETVAKWVHDEWGRKMGRSFPETVSRLLEHEHCPPTQVAANGSSPVGLVGFRKCPLPGANEFQMWIDVLYVDQNFRRRGVASELVRLAERLASEYGRYLYVYTASPQFYTRLQWTLLIDPDSSGCSVLRRELPDK